MGRVDKERKREGERGLPCSGDGGSEDILWWRERKPLQKKQCLAVEFAMQKVRALLFFLVLRTISSTRTHYSSDCLTRTSHWERIR